LTAEEIAQIKADWEEKQKSKAEKAKEKEPEKDKGDNKDGGKSKDESSKGKDKSGGTPPKVTLPTATPPHEKYALHRNMFALRTAEHRRRKQSAQAQELAPRLPGAPRSTVN